MPPETPSLFHTLDGQELKPKRSHKWLFVLLTVLVVILIILGGTATAAYFVLYIPGQKVIASAKKLEATAAQIQTIAREQKDLDAVKSQFKQIDSDLGQIKSQFNTQFAWLKNAPIGRAYYADAQHSFAAADSLLKAGNIILDAIVPYAELLGFKSSSSSSAKPEAARDRIQLIVTTLDALKPRLSEVGEQLAKAKTEVIQIDPNRYPKEYKGIQIRAQLAQGIQVLDDAADLVTEARPLLEAAPQIMGKDQPIKYLLIFQNDAELRPTGGFMTGYAVITVNKGKISVEQSADIYNLDEKFPKKIPAPEPIKKYHPLVPYWYLRDQNLSPDFKVSMDTFYPNYLLTRSPEVKGIIALDTQVLVKLLQLTGPIGISGYGNFSAENDNRCNCPNVFYQLQVLAGAEEPVVWDNVTGKIVHAPANYGQRKAFLGPIMYSILVNTLGQPKTKFGQMFETALNLIEGKHVLFYYLDPHTQSAVESFNMAGRIRPSEPNQDYLAVVDTNFSGGKTNIWVKYDAETDVAISSDGSVSKTLTLKYSNPEDKSIKIETGRYLNGKFRDWLRVYVPEGSELDGPIDQAMTGFETGMAVGRDLGKTFFEGFFTLTPGNTVVIKIKYKLPFKVQAPYRVLLQKQGGAKDFFYKIKLNGKSLPEVILTKDQDLSYSF